jgi:hypothetical protein
MFGGQLHLRDRQVGAAFAQGDDVAAAVFGCRFGVRFAALPGGQAGRERERRPAGSGRQGEVAVLVFFEEFRRADRAGAGFEGRAHAGELAMVGERIHLI